MILFGQLQDFDWQGGVVLLVVTGALAYLLIRGRLKKSKGCGSEGRSCGCVKTKAE